MKQYLKRKFVIGYFFQLAINIVLLIIISFIIKMNFLLLFITILGNILGTYLLSLHYFSRDYYLRMSNWTNVTELFNRGGGNLVLFLTMFFNSVLAFLVVGGYVVLIYRFTAMWVNICAVLIVIGSSVLAFRYYQRKFWSQFN